MMILHLIEAHRAAIIADEANFDDDGNPLDAEAAERSLEVEQAAYCDLIRAQCASADDVQAKLLYLLTGSVGMRSTLIECLTHDAYCNGDLADENLTLKLLASLSIDAA
jgi:hypothetical protein